jgi:porphyrinogen peroxidase
LKCYVNFGVLMSRSGFKAQCDTQLGILAPIPQAGLFLSFTLSGSVAEARAALLAVREACDPDYLVLGIGQSLVLALDREIPGLRPFPNHSVAGLDLPSTPAALWCWLSGADAGEVMHAERKLLGLLEAAFSLTQRVNAFKHGAGRDLTGYEDGTENPQDEAAIVAAVVSGVGLGLDGSSFAAVQQWRHDFDKFDAMSTRAQDHSIGRRKTDNEELDDAPASAHVKRTAQESFSPEAFVVRRSMPWAEAGEGGLMFLAFGASLDAFEAQLRRMVGGEDGIVDALFNFTRPLTGAYFWCPPLREGRLDFSALGL